MTQGLRKEPTIATHKPTRWWIAPLCFTVLAFGFALGFVANREGWLEAGPANDANTALPDDLDYESVEEVYDELKRSFDGELNEEELLNGIKQGLADASGDDYTDYFSATESEAFLAALNGSFEGIGAELGTENELLIVVAPLSGFPAEQAGVRAGDIIAKVDGEDTLGLSVEEAVIKIRGEAGSTVTLTVIRNGAELEIPIVRATIVVPSVDYEVLDDTIGYIKVARFADDTSALARQAATDLKAQGVQKIVLDLRNNSGGFVDAAVNVASIWQDTEVVYEQRTGDRVTNSSRAVGNPILDGLETIVLVNEGSASASEIVAGALRDNGYASIVGAQSFGKGSVQKLEDFTDGSTLKVTIARWFTPGGINIDKDGITPDIEVEFTNEDFENDRDPQLDRAKQELSN